MKKYYCPNCERQQEFRRYESIDHFFCYCGFTFGGCEKCGVIIDLTITMSEEEAQKSLKKAQKALGFLEEEDDGR